MDFDLLQPTPDLDDIALMLETAVRRDGLVIQLPPVVRDFQKQTEEIVALLRRGESLPEDLRYVVPDFWHIAKGKAIMLTREDGQRLVNAMYYGHGLGKAYMERDYSNPLPNTKNGYPAAVFKPRHSQKF